MSRQLAMAVASGFALIAAGPCSKSEESAWRQSFVSAARQLDFDTERKPVRDPGLPPSANTRGVPQMTLAWRASDTGSTGRVARIRSDAAYRALGIAPGDNYVWIDRLDSRARHMIVPADTSYPISVFVVRPDSHRPDGDPMRLRLLNDDASSDGSPPRDPRPPAPGERDSVHVFLCWKCKAVAATTYESTRTVVKADSATSWCSTGRTAIVKSDGSSDTPIKAMQAYFESAGIRWRRGSDVVVP